MAAIWTTQRERGHPGPLRLFTWIALTLGRPIARLLLYPIVLYFVFAGGDARAASRDYLRRVLGREARLLDGFRHVHCFASVILDRLYLLNERHHLFRIDVVGSDVMEAAMAEPARADGSLTASLASSRASPRTPPRTSFRTSSRTTSRSTRGAFVIGAHLGSFEAVRAGGREREDLRVSMVMYEDNAQYLSEVFAAINPRLAQSIIPLGHVDSMLRVKRALDDGGLVGMLGDRTLGEDVDQGGGAVRKVDLLGDTVAIPTGPFRMAAMLRRPVIFIVGLYRGGNRYEVHYEELYDFSRLEDGVTTSNAVDAAIDRYVGRLEHYCTVAPYNWFNFYDYWNDVARPGTCQYARRVDR